MRKLLILVLVLCACRARETAVAHPPVILISIDTLRADHLPMFGYGSVETPHLDALRRDGILFTSAYAHAPLTLPSHVTVLTGLLPPANGVRNNIGYRLEPSVPTIGSMLRAAGYDTGAAVSAYVLRGTTGLASSFDFYEDAIESRAGTPTGDLQRSGDVTASLAKQWIAQRNAKPFFLFLHLFEPHSPYEPTYDADIARADAIVGDFLADLKARGLYDRALIIFFSDHGEGLGQHGEPEHGIFLYREAIHVPLVVKLPFAARAGDTIANPVGLVDILPTIAQLTGATAPAKVDGVSLLAAPAERRIYSETLYPRIHLGWSELRSLEDARHHFIQAPRPELYDMQSDPAETRNILADERRVYSAMKEELARHTDNAALPTHIDPEEAKKLAALGYLGSAAGPTSGPLPDPKDRIGEIADMIRAVTLAHEGRGAEAVPLFRAILAKNPKLSDAWNELALTLEKLGRNEEASEAYRQAIENAPQLAAEFALSRGNVLLALGKLDEAAKHADLGASANAKNAELLRGRIAAARGDVLARAERYPEAIEAFRKSIAAYPHELSAYAKLAIVYRIQNRDDDARAVIAEMLRNNDTDEARKLAEKTRRELEL